MWQTMQTVVASGAMPFRGDPTVMPPVKELTAAQLATLATWFKEGAQPLGGRDCPQTCNWSSPPP